MEVLFLDHENSFARNGWRWMVDLWVPRGPKNWVLDVDQYRSATMGGKKHVANNSEFMVENFHIYIVDDGAGGVRFKFYPHSPDFFEEGKDGLYYGLFRRLIDNGVPVELPEFDEKNNDDFSHFYLAPHALGAKLEKGSNLQSSVSEKDQTSNFATDSNRRVLDNLRVLGFEGQRDIDEFTSGEPDPDMRRAAEKIGFTVLHIQLPEGQPERFKHLWNETADASQREFDFVYDKGELIAILPSPDQQVLDVAARIKKVDEKLRLAKGKVDGEGDLLQRHINDLMQEREHLAEEIHLDLRSFDFTNYWKGPSPDLGQHERSVRRVGVSRLLADRGLQSIIGRVFSSPVGFMRLVYWFGDHGVPGYQASGVTVDTLQPMTSSPPDGNFQIDVEINETVYVPFHAADVDYYETVLSYRNMYDLHRRKIKLPSNLGDIKTICVVGAGSGADLIAVYLKWLQEKGLTPEQARGRADLQPTFRIREINPFAVAGLQNLVEQLGLVNVLLEEGSGLPTEGQYDLLIWNMPGAGPSNGHNEGRLAERHDYGENGDAAIYNVRELLPTILSPNGVAILWNDMTVLNTDHEPPTKTSIKDFLSEKQGRPSGLQVSTYSDLTDTKKRANSEVYIVTLAAPPPAPRQYLIPALSLSFLFTASAGILIYGAWRRVSRGRCFRLRRTWGRASVCPPFCFSAFACCRWA